VQGLPPSQCLNLKVQIVPRLSSSLNLLAVLFYIDGLLILISMHLMIHNSNGAKFAWSLSCNNNRCCVINWSIFNCDRKTMQRCIKAFNLIDGTQPARHKSCSEYKSEKNAAEKEEISIWDQKEIHHVLDVRNIVMSGEKNLVCSLYFELQKCFGEIIYCE
jgi:hypothetical protein